MSAMTRWSASVDPRDETGVATFSVAGEVLNVKLPCFADANALDRLISMAEQLAGDRARRACAVYLRGAVNHIESAQP